MGVLGMLALNCFIALAADLYAAAVLSLKYFTAPGLVLFPIITYI
jgi:hypothetical protein